MKHCMIAIILFFVVQLYSITITKSDYGWEAGKVRKYREGSWTQSSTDLSEGTGKTWNFTTPTTGYQDNTYQNCSNVAGFPNATIVQQYSQLVNGYAGTGSVYYQETAEDFIQVGYTGSPNLLWNPGIPTGLPHYLNKTWQDNHAWTYGTYNVTGKVIAEGTLTTHWGTHQALLVRYHYITTNLTYDCYQWETREYGIEVFSNTLNGGMVYVLNEADQNTVLNDDDTQVPVSLKIVSFPNPAQGAVNLKMINRPATPTDISIFNIRGEVVYQRRILSAEDVIQWNGTDRKGRKSGSGYYFYIVKAGNHSAKGSFIYLK